jgi:hypothetical protein
MVDPDSTSAVHGDSVTTPNIASIKVGNPDVCV